LKSWAISSNKGRSRSRRDGEVFDAVERLVTCGLEHRTLGRIDIIGVDETAGRVNCSWLE
jgi:hypothetical protein